MTQKNLEGRGGSTHIGKDGEVEAHAGTVNPDDPGYRRARARPLSRTTRSREREPRAHLLRSQQGAAGIGSRDQGARRRPQPWRDDGGRARIQRR
jgi:hypothetical protein